MIFHTTNELMNQPTNQRINQPPVMINWKDLDDAASTLNMLSFFQIISNSHLSESLLHIELGCPRDDEEEGYDEEDLCLTNRAHIVRVMTAINDGLFESLKPLPLLKSLHITADVLSMKKARNDRTYKPVNFRQDRTAAIEGLFPRLHVLMLLSLDDTNENDQLRRMIHASP